MASGYGAAADRIIRLDPRTGIPLGVLPKRGAGAVPEAANGAGARGGGAGPADAAAAQGEEAGEGAASDGDAAAPEVSFERRKDESAEEKRARKAAVKEAQRIAREQKKELKTLFKGASLAAQRRVATAQPQAALHLPS